MERLGSITNMAPASVQIKRKHTFQLVSRHMSQLCTAMAASPPIVRLNTASDTALRQTPGKFCGSSIIQCTGRDEYVMDVARPAP